MTATPVDPGAPPRGRIVTFYSYKGGTGRSMLLANVAWVLASNGLRVLVIDWDLEAPGLHRYFSPFLSDTSLASSHGLIDFLVDFTTAAVATEPAPAGQDQPWYVAHANLLTCAFSLDWPHFPPRGTLDFVPAGRQDAGYAVRVNSFDWSMFYGKLGGGLFLEEVKRRLRERYDYVLIDSRTGVSDTSGICTIQMPDDLVVCFTLNQQSIEGASSAAASAHQQRRKADGTPGLRILPIVSRIDTSEKERLEIARQAARERFDPFLDWLDEDQLDLYWATAALPYVPFYAYEEILATFGDGPDLAHSLLSSVETITGWLTDQEVIALPRMDEERRLIVKARFLRRSRTPASGSSPMYVSYARREADETLRRFVDDLTTEISSLVGRAPEQLVHVDWRSAEPPTLSPAEAAALLSGSRIAVCLVSPSYWSSPFCAVEWSTLRTLSKPIIPVVWVEHEIPHAMHDVQWFGTQPDFRTLARLHRRRDEYVEAVHRVAKEIADRLKRDARSTPVEAPPAGTVASIPLVVIAARRDGIRPPRVNMQPYGMSRRDWRPFWSTEGKTTNGKTASDFGREASTRNGLTLRPMSLHRFDDWLSLSRRPFKEDRAIILVDPWTALLTEHHDLLHRVQRVDGIDVEVITCLDGDVETKQARSRLVENVQSIFYAAPPRMRLGLAESPSDLERQLDSACAYLTAVRPSNRRT